MILKAIFLGMCSLLNSIDKMLTVLVLGCSFFVCLLILSFIAMFILICHLDLIIGKKLLIH